MAEERAAPRSGSSLTGSYLEREEAVVELCAESLSIPGIVVSGWNREFRKKKKKEKGKMVRFHRLAGVFRPIF